MYVVILAGGGGTRLWPLSRVDRPKPFLPLTGPETLFQRTVARVAPLVGAGDVFCVADGRYASLVAGQAPGVVLVPEPAARNTAPAIALATLAVARPDDEVMVVLPADHWIADEARFRAVLRAAHDGLAAGAPDLGIAAPLVTLGVRPDRPATEYGYLRPDHRRPGDPALGAWALEAFEEKPAPDRARELLAHEGVAWNAGMFLWQRGAIRDALARHTGLLGALDGAVEDPGTLARAYEAIAPISIDYAVMEPAAREGLVAMAALDAGWNDLGSWTELLAALGLPAVDARVLKPGDAAEVTADDLLVERRDGRLVAGPPPSGGTMTAAETTAVLRGARPHQARVDELLARCSGA